MSDMARKQMNDMLTQLQIKGDVYMKQLMLEKKRVKDLDDALRIANEQIRKYRENTKQSAIDVLNLHRFTKNPAHQRADGLNPTKAADTLQKKQVSILEVRLNKLKIRDAEAEHYNERLKMQIDDLRKKRMVLDQSHEKYEGWLLETRQRIFDLMEKASKAHDDREKIIERRNEQLRKNEEERKRFEEDYLQKGDFIEMQNQLFEESIAQAAKGMEKKLKAAASGGPMNEAYSAEGPNHPLIPKLREIATANELEKNALDALQDKIRAYETSFEELKRVSGIDNIEELMTVFRKNEEETFSLFNYIQTVNQEIEWTMESHAQMQEEMKVFEQQQKEEDHQRAEIIRLNQEKLEGTAKSNREAKEGVQEVSVLVDRIAKKIQSLFFKMQCDQMYGTEGQKSSSGKSNGSKATAAGQAKDRKAVGKVESKLMSLSGNTVNDSNIVDYMRVIEQRLVQIINEYTKKMSQKDETVANIPLVGPSVPMNDKLEGPQLIRAPDSIADEEGEDGLTDEKPLPVDVIRRRCKDKVVVGAAAAFTNTSRASNVKPKVPRRISRTAN